MWIICNWRTIPVCQETVLWTSVSDCKWCHPQALKMCRGGKWAPLRFCITPAPLHHFGTFIKCYHNRSLPLRTTLYICKKNFSTRAHAPLREHRLQVNSGQIWGDMRRRDAVGFSESLGVLRGCWCLQLATPRAGTPECSCFTWTVLPPFFSAGVFDLLCRHRDCVVSSYDVMGHTEHWKVNLMGPWWSVELSSAAQTVLFIF